MYVLLHNLLVLAAPLYMGQEEEARPARGRAATAFGWFLCRGSLMVSAPWLN